MTNHDRNFLTRDEFESFEKVTIRSFDDLGSAVNQLSRKIDDMATRGTNWNAVFAGLGLMTSIIMGVGGIVAWGLNSRLETQGEAVSALADKSWEHQRDGHPARIEALVMANKEALEDLDVVLHRELATLDQTSLDRRKTLKDEMTLRIEDTNKAVGIELDWIKSSLGRGYRPSK